MYVTLDCPPLTPTHTVITRQPGLPETSTSTSTNTQSLPIATLSHSVSTNTTSLLCPRLAATTLQHTPRPSHTPHTIHTHRLSHTPPRLSHTLHTIHTPSHTYTVSHTTSMRSIHTPSHTSTRPHTSSTHSTMSPASTPTPSHTPTLRIVVVKDYQILAIVLPVAISTVLSTLCIATIAVCICHRNHNKRRWG